MRHSRALWIVLVPLFFMSSSSQAGEPYHSVWQDAELSTKPTRVTCINQSGTRKFYADFSIVAENPWTVSFSPTENVDDGVDRCMAIIDIDSKEKFEVKISDASDGRVLRTTRMDAVGRQMDVIINRKTLPAGSVDPATGRINAVLNACVGQKLTPQKLALLGSISVLAGRDDHMGGTGFVAEDYEFDLDAAGLSEIRAEDFNDRLIGQSSTLGAGKYRVKCAANLYAPSEPQPNLPQHDCPSGEDWDYSSDKCVPEHGW